MSKMNMMNLTSQNKKPLSTKNFFFKESSWRSSRTGKTGKNYKLTIPYDDNTNIAITISNPVPKTYKNPKTGVSDVGFFANVAIFERTNY